MSVLMYNEMFSSTSLHNFEISMAVFKAKHGGFFGNFWGHSFFSFRVIIKFLEVKKKGRREKNKENRREKRKNEQRE